MGLLWCRPLVILVAVTSGFFDKVCVGDVVRTAPGFGRGNGVVAERTAGGLKGVRVRLSDREQARWWRTSAPR